MSALQILILTIAAIIVVCAIKATLRLLFGFILQGIRLRLRRFYVRHGLSLDSAHFEANRRFVLEAEQVFATLSFATLAALLLTDNKRQSLGAARGETTRPFFASCGNVRLDRGIDRIVDTAWYYAICGIVFTSALFWLLIVPALAISIYERITIKRAQAILVSAEGRGCGKTPMPLTA